MILREKKKHQAKGMTHRKQRYRSSLNLKLTHSSLSSPLRARNQLVASSRKDQSLVKIASKEQLRTKN